MKNKTSINIWVTLILILGFILRLVSINQSLWLDEAIGALAVRDFSYWGIVSNFLKFDNHPPLYYLLLKFWSGMFGYTEISLRMPSVLFGVGVIYLTYKISKLLLPSNNLFALSSALLISTSQIHVYYSQEARMYSMACFFASLAIYYFIKLLKANTIKNWLLFSIALTLLVFTDYMPVYLVAIFPIFGLINKKGKEWFCKMILAYLPIVFIGLFWLPSFLIQIKGSVGVLNNLPGWGNVVGKASLKELLLVWIKFSIGRITLQNKGLYYLIVALFSLPFVYSLYSVYKKRSRELQIIYLWLLVPIILGFSVSFFIPSFNYFRFLYVLPSLYILISYGLTSSTINNKQFLIFVSIILINLSAISIYYLDLKQQRERWRQAVSFIEDNADKESVVVFNFPDPFAPYRWYQKGVVDAFGVSDKILVTKNDTEIKVRNSIVNKKEVYYFDYLWQLSDPQRIVEQTIKSSGYNQVNIYDFQGVGLLYKYEKQ